MGCSHLVAEKANGALGVLFMELFGLVADIIVKQDGLEHHSWSVGDPF